MSYRVQIDAYQGPFDLLLQLVSRQKVDIGAISVTQIADQYLAEVERMQELDLDIASDFLVVAATLLQIKAASLVPAQERAAVELDDEEFAELSPEETRDILVARLVNYKKFKNAAAALGARMEAESRMHPRHAGIEERFLDLVPDYLQGVTLHGLAVICADIAARRETFLLEAEHIAAVPISMERHVEGIYRTMRSRSARTFSQLVGEHRAGRDLWRDGAADGARRPRDHGFLCAGLGHAGGPEPAGAGRAAGRRARGACLGRAR